MDLKMKVTQLTGPQRIELIGDLLSETLGNARAAGVDAADAAHGLLNLTITTMTAAVGPVGTSKWLLSLASAIMDDVENSRRAASAERN